MVTPRGLPSCFSDCTWSYREEPSVEEPGELLELLEELEELSEEEAEELSEELLAELESELFSEELLVPPAFEEP
ncbi:MAG: hypothetical protein V3R91_00275 [Myxococcota bacterium]